MMQNYTYPGQALASHKSEHPLRCSKLYTQCLLSGKVVKPSLCNCLRPSCLSLGHIHFHSTKKVRRASVKLHIAKCPIVCACMASWVAASTCCIQSVLDELRAPQLLVLCRCHSCTLLREAHQPLTIQTFSGQCQVGAVSWGKFVDAWKESLHQTRYLEGPCACATPQAVQVPPETQPGTRGVLLLSFCNALRESSGPTNSTDC
jgi:hypothetical protein